MSNAKRPVPAAWAITALLAGCAMPTEDDARDEQPPDVVEAAQSLQAGPFGLSQEFDGSQSGTFANVDASLVIERNPNGKGGAYIDFEFLNRSSASVSIHVVFAVACNTRSDVRLEVVEFTAAPGGGHGFIYTCADQAKAATSFNVD